MPRYETGAWNPTMENNCVYSGMTVSLSSAASVQAPSGSAVWAVVGTLASASHENTRGLWNPGAGNQKN